jgi:two-component system NtrC family sensor kinase
MMLGEAVYILSGWKKTESHLERSLLGECEYHITFAIISGKKNVKYMEAKGNIVRDDEGRPVYMYGFNFDKTEEYSIKKEIENEKEVIHQSERMVLLGEMASEIGHEINNPLAIILGYANILVNEGTEFSNEYLQIEKAAKRIENIVRGLKTLSYSKPQKRVFDLGKTLKEMYFLIKDIYRLDEIDIEINDFSDGVFMVFGDEGRVQQVIMNSLSNAKDALANVNNKKIGLNIYTLKKEVIVKISDNGEGIEKDELEKVFMPFYSTKEKGKGTGVGLSLSKTVMRELGGRINVESELRRGTTFSYVFPLSTNHDYTEQVNITEKDEGITLTENSFKGMSALIIDDETQLLNILSSLLEDFGMEVNQFNDPAEGIKFYEEKKGRFNFILSDLRMPKIDGIEFMEKVLSMRFQPIPKLFILSGGVTDSEISDKLKLSLSGILEKPYHEEEILKQLLSSVIISEAS